MFAEVFGKKGNKKMSILSFKLEDIRRLSVKDFFKRLYAKAWDEEDLLSSAAQVAFYFAFALFPLLLFLVTLFGIVLESANDLRTEMFFYLRQVMPGSASDLVQKTIDEVTQNSSGGKLTLGLAVALYSASAGIDSIRIALNGVYNLTETRPFWKTKLLTLFLTFVLAILITIALGVIFYGGKFLNLILSYVNLPIQSPFFLGVLQTVTVLVVLVSTFALLYNYLPKHKKSTWVWITPGAIVGIVLWLALSYAFRLYLDYFNTYDKTYGSLGAVIILMLWLYLTALVILIGGSMNAVLQEFTDPETAAAGEKKAHAKEIVQNPNSKSLVKEKLDALKEIDSPASDKKDGAAAKVAKTENRLSEPDDKKPEVVEYDDAEVEKIGKKSIVNLTVGTVFGFLMGLFFSKKKR
jgi:membrane protein